MLGNSAQEIWPATPCFKGFLHGRSYAATLIRMNTRFSEADFPANGSPRQKLEFALKYAALAPIEGGWLPWHFRMTDTHLELLTKNSPAREEADPDRREFLIGCGSALVYLKQALKHFGCLGRVDLFPDLGDRRQSA